MSIPSPINSSSVASAILVILLDAAVKSTLVLGVAGLAICGMRRCSAAARHFAWFLAVSSLLVLPLLSWTLPGWQILPRWMNFPAESAEAARQSPAIRPIATPTPVEPTGGFEPVAPLGQVPTAPSIREATPNSPPQPVATVDSTSAGSNGWHVALAIWIAGTLLALLPTVLGRFSLWRLERGSRRETAASWLELLQSLLAGLKFTRAVDLLKTNRRRMPMTWGVIRPKLLLPEQSQEWTEERRRVVMLHELAHAKRWDYLTNLITQLACALYWFNPLVWLAARQMIVERERACDDVVLRHGAKPSDYAEQLLHIAAGLPVDRFVAYAGIAMARPSKLEDRLRAILDDRRNRATLTRLVAIGALALLVAVIVPVAMMRAASGNNTHATPAATQSPVATQTLTPSTDDIRGVLIDDATGSAITHFWLQEGAASSNTPNEIVWSQNFNGPIVTEARGRFRLRFENAHQAWRILAAGYSPELVRAPSAGSSPESTVRMRRAGELRGTVRDYLGKPVAGATVLLTNVDAQFPTNADVSMVRGNAGTTDPSGRFAVQRPALVDLKLIAVSRDGQMIHPLRLSESDNDLDITLPQPAALVVRYDMPGDQPKATIGMALRTFEIGKLWNGIRFEVSSTVTNRGETVLPNLRPGTYTLIRQTTLRMVGRDATFTGESRMVILEAGQTQRVDFVRSPGRRIRGTVTGLEPLGIQSGTVSVRTGENYERGIDVAAFGADGRFATAPMEPGSYHLIATVSLRNRITNAPLSYIAHAHIIVAADADPPPVKLDLVPWTNSFITEVRAQTNRPEQRQIDARLPPGRQLNGHVVDAATGEPIVNFVVQKGSTNFFTTNQIVWQLYSMGYAENQGVWSVRMEDYHDRAVRIVSPGYVPEILTRESLAGKATSDLEIRLRRGEAVQGTVIDADGRPVNGARVYLTTVQSAYFGTYYGPFKGDTNTTDNSGRFTLHGEGGAVQNVVVATADNHLVWPAIQSNPREDLRIVLPRPGTLIVRYDIPGDAPKATPEIWLMTTNKEMPLWRNLDFRLSFSVANRSQIVLTNLTPGTYSVRRWKSVDPNGGAESERRSVQVEAGQTQYLDLVRTNGQRIRGRVIGWDQVKTTGADAFIYVRSPEATGQPWPQGSRNSQKEFPLPYYDVSKVTADGTFETSMLTPGTYSIIAHVHPPEPPLDWRISRNRNPDFVGLTRATVTSAAVEPVNIQLAPAHYVDIAGTVVDDATGAPVSGYAMQQGTINPDKPGEISWTSGYSGGHQDGHFLLWAQKEGVAWRFLANGYLPQIFTRSEVLASRQSAQLQVRLKRGGELRGVVLDHTGWPVASAKVVLAPAGRDDLPGKPVYWRQVGAGHTFAVTDAAGRFSMRGVGEGPSRVIALSDDGQMVQPMQLPAGTKEVTINFPKPASLIVRYDIPDDMPELNFSLQLQTNKMEAPLWNDVIANVSQKVPNRGQIIINNLTPGAYDFWRDRRAGVTNAYNFIYGNPIQSVQSDFRTLVLESGRTQRLDLVRSIGHRLQGRLTGLERITNSVGVFLYVGSATAIRNPLDYETNLAPCFDVVRVGKDGRFETALLEPGSYTLIAEVFVPGKPPERKAVADDEPSGVISGSLLRLAYVGSTKVTLGAVAAPGPVTIELRPHGDAAEHSGGQAQVPAFNSPAVIAGQQSNSNPVPVSERKVSLRARQMPLKDALATVCRQAHVELTFDREAFEFEGLTNVLVTTTIVHEPLQSAVAIILDRLPWDHFIFQSLNGEKLLVSGHRIVEDRKQRALPDWLRRLYNEGLLATLDEDRQVISISVICG